MSDHALRFMSTLKRSRDIDKSLQSLYNTAIEDGESPAKVLKTAETFLPGLEETVDFSKYKKTSTKLHKRPMRASDVAIFSGGIVQGLQRLVHVSRPF